MTTQAKPTQVFIDSDASDLAFRAGQLVARLLIQRAIELAKHRASDESVVKVDQILESIDESIIIQLQSQVRDFIDGCAEVER